MAKLITILSLTIFLILSLHFQTSTSFQDDENEVEHEYILDQDDPIYVNPTDVRTTTRSRFLKTSQKKTIKNAKCDVKKNVCNGVWADKGTSLLQCCTNHCRNVLGDRNNCGQCGKKCKYGERCCGGVCTNVLSNAYNCGKCGKSCGYGVKCEYGYCGYA